MSKSLGDRMKGYEEVSRTKLMRRMPAIIRLDGKCFGKFTKNFEFPHDKDFKAAMCDAATAVCKEIQGAKIAYTQSDEITILITDYETFNTEAWYDYQVQKMVSVSASTCTAAFIRSLAKSRPESLDNLDPKFDSRVFTLPKEEVVNNFIFRQQDATRNSIQMLGRAYFSHAELYKKTGSDIQDMLMIQNGVNWNDQLTAFKRGQCIIKEKYKLEPLPERSDIKDQVMRNIEVDGNIIRTRWIIDGEVPIFTKNREYINKYVYTEDEEDEKNNC